MAAAIRRKSSIDFLGNYDPEGDAYYVTFNTGEPSYCVEVDDDLLLEVGLFTALPTGFRILNFHKAKKEAVQIELLIKKIEKTIKDSEKSVPSIRQREADVTQALEKVLA